eukprot:Opistho-2@58351
MRALFVLAVLATAALAAADPVPVVLWHGMGDNCCLPESMGSIQKMIESQVPGVYVKSLRIGDSAAQDSENSFFMDSDAQVANVCAQLAADPKLANGFNALGFSQGGQFLRAYVQRCNKPQMLNLITFGAQHQGVYGMPRCIGANWTLCEVMRSMLNVGAYESYVQHHLVQAQYWHDPKNEKEYLEKSAFLADINNARADKNATYKQNLLTLKNFVMVKFTKDTMVQPRESEWFGFYEPGQDKLTLAMQNTSTYINDDLGLQELNAGNRLHFLEADGDHLQFTDAFFTENIIPYLQ